MGARSLRDRGCAAPAGRPGACEAERMRHGQRQDKACDAPQATLPGHRRSAAGATPSARRASRPCYDIWAAPACPRARPRPDDRCPSPIKPEPPMAHAAPAPVTPRGRPAGAGRWVGYVSLIALLVVVFATPTGAAAAAATAPEQSFFNSRVLVTAPQLPDAAQVQAELQRRVGPSLQVTRVINDTTQQLALIYTNQGTLTYSLHAAPMDDRWIDWSCYAAWSWPGACAAVKPHQGYIFVSLLAGPTDQVEGRLLMTHFIAAVMDDNAIANDWRGVLQPRAVVHAASAQASRAAPPIELWARVHLVDRGARGVSMQTWGLRSIGLPELRASRVRRSADEVGTATLNAARQLAAAGPGLPTAGPLNGGPILIEPKARRGRRAPGTAELRWVD
jgi:hypothetical protein